MLTGFAILDNLLLRISRVIYRNPSPARATLPALPPNVTNPKFSPSLNSLSRRIGRMMLQEVKTADPRELIAGHEISHQFCLDESEQLAFIAKTRLLRKKGEVSPPRITLNILLETDHTIHSGCVSGFYNLHQLSDRSWRFNIAINVHVHSPPQNSVLLFPQDRILDLNNDIRETLRHEFQHALQDDDASDYASVLQKHDRDSIMWWATYLLSQPEIEAFSEGIYLAAKKKRTNFVTELKLVLSRFRRHMRKYADKDARHLITDSDIDNLLNRAAAHMTDYILNKYPNASLYANLVHISSRGLGTLFRKPSVLCKAPRPPRSANHVAHSERKNEPQAA